MKTIVSRRYLGCVLCSLMYRYGVTLSESVSETDIQALGVGTQFRKGSENYSEITGDKLYVDSR